MLSRNESLIRPGAALVVIGVAAVLLAGVAAALIKAIGYVVIVGGVAAIIVGLVKRWRRPRRRRAVAH